jgi:LuxR family maltose regulon positive regulatory protein
VRPVSAARARVLVERGQLVEALNWARERRLSAAEDLCYLREFEHITLARVLLARSRVEQSAAFTNEVALLLERLAQAAEAGRRTGSLIEILVLQALTHHAHGDIRGALLPLEGALTLAEPEGYVRVFTGEGPALTALLRAVAKERPKWSYVRRLLRASDDAGQATPASQGLVEPLSERELGVLRLLGTELDGPDIARQLSVSLNTIRTHTKNIYTKLGVNNRRAAVRRATELDLLSHRTDRSQPAAGQNR